MEKKDRLRSAINPSTELIFPLADQETCSHLQRWSDIGVRTPFAIVVPANEDDVVSIVKFAASEGLQIIVGGGGRGSYVPIDSKSLYVDLRLFNTISVDPGSQSVTVGGGAKTGDTARACAKEHVYTLLPNANSVGVVGATLGGGSSPLKSIHGLAADHILSARLITAEGVALDVIKDPTAKESGLSSMIGCAGDGIGVITSLTLRAWPLSGLAMKDGKAWVRTLVFPGSAIATAAKLYCDLQTPPARLQTTIIVARPPKTPPEPSPPTIILSASFFGPEDEAEKAAASLLAPELEKQAVVARTAFVAIEDLNNSAEPLNQPRQFKEIYTCVIKQTTPLDIQDAFEEFVRFGDSTEDARARSYMVIASWNPTVTMRNAKVRNELSDISDRSILVQAIAWYADIDTKPAADSFGNSAVDIMQRADQQKGVPKMTFTHNLRLGQDIRESYSPELITEYLKVKRYWDPKDLFWSPLTDKDNFVLPS